MTGSTLRVRRATVDDLDALRALWTSMRLPAAELEPRLTEFQIVEDQSEQKIVGAIGFQVAAQQGRLHSEGFTDFAIADAAREQLWDRIQTLATNHGILRLWTNEATPFWTRLGFKTANTDDLKKLPPAWNNENKSWLTQQLKDEAAISAVEQELAMFMHAQKQQSTRLFEKMRVVKTLATIIAVIIAIFALGAAIFFLIKRPDILHPGR